MEKASISSFKPIEGAVAIEVDAELSQKLKEEPTKAPEID